MKANWLDRAIGVVSPRAQLRRMRDRAAVEVLARAYDAAKPDRRRGGRRPPSTGANAESWSSLRVLRAASREAIRNSGYARKANRTLATKLVGTGITPRAATGDEKLDKEINDAFAIWSKECDASGTHDYFGLQKLAALSFFENGEALARRRRRFKSDGLHVPLEIQLLEPDHLDERRNEILSDGMIVQGIQTGKGRERRTAYWLFPYHPGETVGGLTPFKSESAAVPAADIAHFYDKIRIGAQRGVPWLVAVLIALEDIGDYRISEQMRKKLEACFVGAVIGDDSSNADPTLGPRALDAEGNLVESVSPGMLFRATGAKQVQFHQPTTNPDYPGYMKSELRGIAAGACMTYELLTSDLSDVNFSSYRAGLNDLHEMIGQLQWLDFIPMFCEPTWKWFIDAAFLAGRISRRHYGVEWEPPKFVSADPLKDFLADLGEVRAGFQAPQQAIARRGYNHRKVLADHIAWKTAVDEVGLVFDIDAAKVTKTGAANGIEAGGTDRAMRIARVALDILEAEGDPDAATLRALINGRV
ncbi:lambda family phage portal protein [Azospirillum agricola]|uniref:phage portal protein n=1 Tax=Azospirillum agricola TaxID=1720247 RepID=UPI001AE5A254|nr:phage portal protein [Azospirillum agricola]MBP2232555.1 lambda family phage portal protein [Azospirillum agricola]